MKFRAEHPEAMERLGAALAGALPPSGGVLFLHGDLGAGKTTLVRGLLRGLGHRGSVRSPTFTLMEPYELGGLQVAHLDLYRIAAAEELEYLGLRDWSGQGSLWLVEWAERAEGGLPAPDLRIRIEHQGAARAVSLEACSADGRRILAALSASAPETGSATDWNTDINQLDEDPTSNGT